MSDINQLINEIKRIIWDVCDKNELYDGSQIRILLNQVSSPDISVLVSEAESTFHSEKVEDRFHSIYLNSLLWFLIDKDSEFVLKISKNALTKKEILNKEPWIALLEELNEMEPIASFFVKHPDYGDRFIQEKLLYILSETNIEMGDKIISFLNSEYEILSSAALTVLGNQNLSKYLPDVKYFFENSKDNDLLVEAAKLLIDWSGDDVKSIIGRKKDELAHLNPVYYSDTIEELELLF